jgi:hypothetical protein
VFDNRMLRRILGPKRDDVTECWRKLHNEKHYKLHSSLDITRVIRSRRMRWALHATRMGAMRNAYTIFVGKTEGKGPLGRPLCGWRKNENVS